MLIGGGGGHEDYACHLFRALFSGPISIHDIFIEITQDYWDTVSEIIASEFIINTTDKYNNMVESKEWTNTYPKDAKNISLTTHLSKLD